MGRKLEPGVEGKKTSHFTFKQETEKKLVVTLYQLINKKLAFEKCLKTEYAIHWKEL